MSSKKKKAENAAPEKEKTAAEDIDIKEKAHEKPIIGAEAADADDKTDKPEKPEKKEKRRPAFGSLFDNDKVMLAVSFIIAFFIWAVMSVNNGETGNYPIADIPVTMELSEDAKESELSVISIDGVPVNDFTATVRVKGNSVTVGSLQKTDIQVYGSNLGNIVASGTYNVSLLARQLGVKNNYDIISVTPSEVKITVDKIITTELPIESQINATSPVEYYIGSPSLSQQTVTVSGPEQSVSKAVKAVVSQDIDKELEETTTFSSLKIELLDSDGKVIDDSSITLSPLEVDATIPVLVKKTVPLTVDFLNAPENFDSSTLCTIEPDQIEIAASAEILEGVDSISVGTVDLSSISLYNAPLTYSIVMPEGVRNISSVENASVTFNLSQFNTKSFAVTRYDFVNVPEGLIASNSDHNTQYVRIIGPKEEIAELTSDDLTAAVDLSGSKIGTSVMPVAIRIDNAVSCWVYGSYTATITVKDANDVSSTASAASSSASSGAASQ